jgi:hypothetical protein
MDGWWGAETLSEMRLSSSNGLRRISELSSRSMSCCRLHPIAQCRGLAVASYRPLYRRQPPDACHI